MQERRNSSALAMELRFSCVNPSIYGAKNNLQWYFSRNKEKSQKQDGHHDHRFSSLPTKIVLMLTTSHAANDLVCDWLSIRCEAII